MYCASVFVKDLSGKKFPDNPQLIYKGKKDVLPMLSIDLELQLFADPGINRKCNRFVNIDTVTIIFESYTQKTVYTLPIAYER